MSLHKYWLFHRKKQRFKKIEPQSIFKNLEAHKFATHKASCHWQMWFQLNRNHFLKNILIETVRLRPPRRDAMTRMFFAF